MMQIILVRHGKPDTSTKALNAKDFPRWIDSYNSARLCNASKPSTEIINKVSACKFVVCSHLSRSLHSASALGLTQTDTDPLFREMEMPHWRFPSPKLSPLAWAVLFRTLWFFGFSTDAESFQQAKKRAVNATEKLLNLAHTHGSVAFIGHGLLNKYIAKNLLKLGWQGPVNPGKRYWEYGIYEYK